MRLAALLTSHNRREKTVSCLNALYAARLPEGVSIEVFLVDDGSTDGTSEAVASTFPRAHIEQASGDLFWCRGMGRAQSMAMDSGCEFLLWLNDDVILSESSLLILLDTAGSHPNSIIVGATRDPRDGEISYGGFRSTSRLNPLKLQRAWSADEALQCTAMNGNVVLIPGKLAGSIGGLDPSFEHGMGDIDYAMRARKLGFEVIAAAGVSGYCARNDVSGTHLDKSLPRSIRFRKMLNRKGLPPRSWFRLVFRHGGWAWPGLAILPYIKVLLGR